MSYTLQAIIAQEEFLKDVTVTGTRVVKLGSGLAMIPFTSEAQQALQISSLPLTDEGGTALGVTASGLCMRLSRRGRLAYIEAEFFGGIGTQACVLFEAGSTYEGPVIGTKAINHALRFLGVQAWEGKDEFETVGLGCERDTGDWVREDTI